MPETLSVSEMDKPSSYAYSRALVPLKLKFSTLAAEDRDIVKDPYEPETLHNQINKYVPKVLTLAKAYFPAII